MGVTVMALMLTSRDALLRSFDATWTAADWEQLPHDDGNRYEIIDGVLYVSTAPSARHQRITRQIFLASFTQIDSLGRGVTLWSPIGVFMPGSHPVQPDLLVVLADDFGIIDDRRVAGVPALLVEILSPSTAEYDREVKREAYARAGVPEFWLVHPDTQEVTVYSKPDMSAGTYLQVTQIPSDGELVSPTLPFRAMIATFFADIVDEAR